MSHSYCYWKVWSAFDTAYSRHWPQEEALQNLGYTGVSETRYLYDLQSASTSYFELGVRPRSAVIFVSIAESQTTALLAGPNEKDRFHEVLEKPPGVQIFLRPIAPPAALGLAGFAGSTWITASYIADWWGNAESPTIFFPFVGIFGGLAQFIAGLRGFEARDTLVTIINTIWGSFWMAIGVLYAFVAAGALEPHSVHTHFPELASWFIVMTVFTWSCALAATARDLVLASCLFSLAIGSTIANCLFAYNGGSSISSGSGDGEAGSVTMGMKAASYFWMFAALLAWWRVTVYLIEEAYGPNHWITKFFAIFRTEMEKRGPYVIPGLGEPGVKRGVPKVMPV